MSINGPRTLVLGGRGFIGRHVVSELQRRELTVAVGSRRPAAGSAQLEVHVERLLAADQWRPLLQGFDVVVNCVGILRPAGAATYERVHHLAPAALAEACAGNGCRLVHVSALGLAATDRSGFLTSKRRGEQAIQGSRADWLIVRPSLLDGSGGYGAAWLRGVSRLPFFFVPDDARGQIAALTVADLSEALGRLCTASAEELRLPESRFFELGGAQTFNFEQYIRGLRRRYSRRPALALRVPALLARLFAHVCDGLRFTPFSFGHWELLRKDNVPAPNRLPELLGRAPAPVVED